jgi:WD40 repeat protein/DNA-binding SARP family transcriptional activator/energy-coupling factor transporter ATP-binding protein EcfA2
MLAVKLLGQFEVRLDGIAIDIPSRTEQSLLAYLILNSGYSFRREQLAGMLWPDAAETNAKGYLRQATWRIRRAIKDHSSDSPDCILSNKISLAFNHQLPFSVDTHLLEKGTGKTALDLLEEISLYQGDLLPGFYEDWVILERERLRTVFDRKMHRLLQCLIDDRNWEALIQQAERWISLGETPEPAYRALMIAYASLGDKGKALTTFMRCLDALEQELGVGPTEETVQLEKRIRAGESLFPTAGQKDLRGYELGEKLGQGSFGSVFRAVHSSTGREVAVKIILPEYANDPDFIRRFESEAQNIARLEHPFIIPLYDYWREPGCAYLVTRLLKGGNLEQALQRGPFDLDRAVKLVDELADGLQAAHQRGLVHQRLKPSDILFDDAGHAYLYDLGMAGILGISDGGLQTVYMAPELLRNEPPTPQADIYSLGIILYQVLSGEMPEIRTENGDGFELASLRLKRLELPGEIDQALRRAAAADPAKRYPDALSLAADFRRAVAGDSLETVDISPLKGSPLAGVANPYKGLAAFDEADAAFFFGREALVQRLVERLAEDHPLARFLAVVGPSGSGKSSLVKAGLIPTMRNGTLPGSNEWFILKMTPGDHPFEELEINLLRISDNPSVNLMEQLRRDERGLLRAVRLALPGDDCQLLLVIDQFEELFTLVENRAEMERFLEGLYIAAIDRRSPLRVVVTLRADFYDRPLMHDNFSKLIQERTEVVVPMSVKELERAIGSPAKLVGVHLHPDLVTAMVVDGKEHPDSLPLLQFALTELFERRQSNTLSLEDYQAMGGLEGVLERSAEAVFERLEANEREMARQLFLRLVTLGEGVEDTRRRALRSELEALDLPRPDVRRGDNGKLVGYGEDPPHTMADVIDLFGRARLLSFDLDPLTRTPTVEITHEALLREWPRLRNWLDEGRADVRTQRALAGAAAEWEKASRDPSFLLHGVRLSQLEGWAEETSLALTGEEREFLQSSLDQREAQRRMEEERQAHLARLERRSRNVLRGLVGVFAAAAIVAILLSLYAFNQQSMARRAEAAALQAQALSVSRELAVQALNNLEEDPERSILLSLQALRTAHTREAEESLHTSLRSSRLRMALPADSDYITSVNYSPDGKMIAAAGQQNVFVWDAGTGVELTRLPGVAIVRFSPAGDLLATGSQDSNIYLFDTSSWQVVHTLRGHTDWVQHLIFNSQGTLLVGSSYDDTFSVWDVSSGEQVFSGPATLHEYTTLDNVMFSPDGKFLFAANFQGDRSVEYPGIMRVYDVEAGWSLIHEYPCIEDTFNISPDGRWLVTRGEELFRAIILRDISAYSSEELAAVSLSDIEPVVIPEAHELLITKFTFNRDGSLLVTSAASGEAKLWSVSDKGIQHQMTFKLQLQSTGDVDISPGSSHVVTSSIPDIVRVWDITLAGASEGFALQAHDGNVGRFHFTPDGSLMVTASSDTTAKIWEAATGELLLTVAGSGSRLSDAAISPDKKYLATSGHDNLAHIYELTLTPGSAMAELRHTLAGHGPGEPIGGIFPGLSTVTFSPDGRRLVTGGTDGFAKIWEVESGRELNSLQAHPEGNAIIRLAVSPDNRYLVTGTETFPGGALAKVWDMDTGEELLTYEGHFNRGRVWSLAISPDGKRVATAGGMIKIWELETGQEYFELSGHTSTISGLAFNSDGRYLASSSADGTARLWNTHTGEFVKAFSSPSGPLLHVEFTPDDKYLLASGSGFVYGYIVDQEELVKLAHSRITRWFRPDECQQFLHQETCPAPPPGTRFASPAY